MENSADPAASMSLPLLPLSKVLSVVSSMPRWRILRELAKGEPLPVYEIASRLGVSSTGVSKHFSILYDCGIVRRGYGCLYSIEPRFLVPGEKSLEFGHVRIRLDLMG